MPRRYNLLLALALVLAAQPAIAAGMAATAVTGWTCRQQSPGQEQRQEAVIVCEAAVTLPPGLAEDYALLVDNSAHAHEVFLNGRAVGSLGAIAGRRYAPIPVLYRLDNRLLAPGQPQQLRIRTLARTVDPGDVEIGSTDAIQRALWLRQLDPLRQLGLNILLDCIGLVLAAFGLREFFINRRDSAFLWFAIALVLETASTGSALVRFYLGPVPLTGFLWAATLFGVPSIVCFGHFARAFIGYPVDRRAVTIEVIYVLSALTFPLGLFEHNWLVALVARIHSVTAVALLAFYPVKAMLERRQGMPKSIRLLLIPLALLLLQLVMRLAGLPVTFSIGPLIISEAMLAFGSLLAALSVLMLERSRGQQVEQERLHQELLAATQVQNLLMASSSHTPNLNVDAVYLPASEVGGDFYQLLPDGDATLVLVGDVSGKGLKAAMSVALVIGAMRNHRARRPAELLAELNAALLDRLDGSFITCACARVEPDGHVWLANAGHVPPYADGREVELPGALPLGITADAEYTEVLVHASHLLFVSDGVTEARNPEGDMFGFERAAGMVARRSWEIARAAQLWGQEDDITVVAVSLQEEPANVR